MSLHPFDIPESRAPLAQANLAELAVELRLCKTEFPQISFALMLEAGIRHCKAQQVETLAARIGLDSEISRRIIWGANRRVELVGAAHQIFKTLIPHEDAVRRLLARG